MSEKSTVERALELARGGNCRSMDDPRRQLKAERYDAVESHLSSGSLKKQLVDAMKTID